MYYEKNMECMKANRINMYNLFENFDKSLTSNPIEEIHSVIAKDEEKAIVITYKGLEYRLNSLYRPKEEAKRWVEQYRFQNINNVISMFGFGNGMFTREIVKKMGKNDILFIYEPCFDIFFHVLNNFDITDILIRENVLIFIEGINEFEYHIKLQGAINITNLKTQTVCIHPQYDKAFAESCIHFYKEIKDNLNLAQININTEMHFGKKIIDNLFNNMKYLYGSNTILELKNNTPDDIPAIVVAAGPSVEENIEELKSVKGKAIIFAVDRILDYLLDSGVEPDFVLTLDPMKPIEYFTTKADIRIPLISYLEANYDILNSHKGKKYICTQNSFVDEIYRKTNKISPRVLPSGSVAILAFSVCLELGFKRIILVGQDLAYNGIQTHAGGIQEDRGDDADVFVEGIDGKQVKSRYDWNEFLKRYEDLIKTNPGVEVIDVKEKGAKIKGTVNMPLKEVINKYGLKTLQSSSIFENMEPTFNSSELIVIKRHLESNLSIIKKMKEKAEIAIKICNSFMMENIRISNHNNGNTQVEKLGKINRYIENQSIYSIMDAYITSKTAQQLSVMNQLSDDMKENSRNTYENAKIIYEAVIDVTDYIKPRLEDTIHDFDKIC